MQYCTSSTTSLSQKSLLPKRQNFDPDSLSVVTMQGSKTLSRTKSTRVLALERVLLEPEGAKANLSHCYSAVCTHEIRFGFGAWQRRNQRKRQAENSQLVEVTLANSPPPGSETRVPGCSRVLLLQELARALPPPQKMAAPERQLFGLPAAAAAASSRR